MDSLILGAIIVWGSIMFSAIFWAIANIFFGG
jgi:hypothetical protein